MTEFKQLPLIMKALRVRHAHIGRSLDEWVKDILSYDRSIDRHNVEICLNVFVKVGYLTPDCFDAHYVVDWDHKDSIQPEDIISANQTNYGMGVYLRKRKIMKIRARAMKKTVDSIKKKEKSVLSWF